MWLLIYIYIYKITLQGLCLSINSQSIFQRINLPLLDTIIHSNILEPLVCGKKMRKVIMSGRGRLVEKGNNYSVYDFYDSHLSKYLLHLTGLEEQATSFQNLVHKPKQITCLDPSFINCGIALGISHSQFSAITLNITLSTLRQHSRELALHYIQHHN